MKLILIKFFGMLGTVLNFITLIVLTTFTWFFSQMNNNAESIMELENLLREDVTLPNEDVIILMDMFNFFIEFSSFYGWIIVLIFLVGFVLNVLYLINVKKKQIFNLKLLSGVIICTFIFLPGALCLIIALLIGKSYNKQLLKK